MGEMAVMGRRGDTKVIWDRNNADEVAAARRQFEELTGRGFAAFSVKKNGEQDRRIREFDPEAEKVILVPQMAGGR
jgi:hypothetical protein